MTTDGRERGGDQVRVQMQTRVRGGEGESALPGVDEVRASFHGQSDLGFARQRSQQARSARGALVAAGALVAVVCLVLMVGRLTSGTPTGSGTVVYGLSLASAALSVELARRTRTRWAMMTVILAAAGASLADALP
ncbi:hypothetical protein ABZ078_24375 [Streptomyces sp. NPDC006385]|uniref:hypothetical protein n=1 Tax=Streptomyces sp. NPDC006385 TaxID=3156761 RepID=UPI0033B31EFA